MTRLRALMLVSLILGAAACDQTEDTPTTPTTGGTSFTQVFTGTLPSRASQSFAFSLASGIPIRLSLSSLTDANENPLTTTLTMTFGRPAGTGCGAVQTVTVQAALATHMHFLASPGTYCVGIADTNGQLPTTATFGIRVMQGDPSSTASAGTETYASVLLPAGFTSRTFEASASGTVTVIMDTISPANVASLNVGVGFPQADGAACQLTRAFVGTRGAQLSLPVEVGTYCVKVSDPGTLTGATSFSLRIVHP